MRCLILLLALNSLGIGGCEERDPLKPLEDAIHKCEVACGDHRFKSATAEGCFCETPPPRPVCKPEDNSCWLDGETLETKTQRHLENWARSDSFFNAVSRTLSQQMSAPGFDVELQERILHLLEEGRLDCKAVRR